jgi:hypothetical protein
VLAGREEGKTELSLGLSLQEEVGPVSFQSHTFVFILLPGDCHFVHVNVLFIRTCRRKMEDKYFL